MLAESEARFGGKHLLIDEVSKSNSDIVAVPSPRVVNAP